MELMTINDDHLQYLCRYRGMDAIDRLLAWQSTIERRECLSMHEGRDIR